MFCQSCGSKIDDGVKFCPSCGTAVNAAEGDIKNTEGEVQSPVNASVVQNSNTLISNVLGYVFNKNNKKVNPIVFIIPAIVIVLGAGFYFLNNKRVSANAEKHFSLGKDLLDKDDRINAEKEFSEAIRLKPKKAEYYIFRSRTYTGDNWFDKVLDDLSTAIKVEPKNVNAWSTRGFLYELGNQNDKAISDYNEWIRLTTGDNIENSKAYAARGNVYYYELDYSKAIADCSKAIELNPLNFSAYRGRAHTYSSVGEYYKSIEDLTFLINNDEQNTASSYNSRAFIYYYIGRYNDALADINKAISIDPNANYYDTRGTIYRAMKNWDRSISDYSEAIRLDSNNAIFWMNRSLAHYWKNNNTAAMNADQNTAFRINTRASAQAYVDIAINWANEGFYGDAVRMYNNALDLDPNNKEILRRKAEAEEKAK
jgi:tetratricopeptide (TPR) repeat protein